MEEKEIIKEMMAGDEPINNEDEDLLGWGEYARLIANAVGNPTSEASMVYAINGAWGSGKSSLLNLVEQKIVEAQVEAEKDAETKGIDKNGRKTVIIHFEPWNCIDQNGIIRSFFDTFESILLLNESDKKLVRILYGMEKVVDATGKIFELVPKLNLIVPVFKKASGLLADYRKSLLEKENNLESRKNELKQYLAEQEEVRFLFIIDDLDRLNVSEMRLVMQLMKSVCNFRNVSYLLAFDRRIVAKALDGEQPSGDGSGESYLSKIVQTTIDVPELPSDKAQEVCEKCLQRLFAEHGEKDIEIVYPISRLLSFFGSLRSIKRYLREVAFALDEFKGEIDPLDLATLTAVKSLDRKTYELLIEFKPALLGLSNYSNYKESFESQYDMTFIGKRDKNLADRIYVYLFPHAFDRVPDRDRLISNRRICNPGVFEAYLKSVPAAVKIPYRDVVDILSLDNDAFLKTCRKYESPFFDNLIKARIDVLANEKDDCLGVAKLLTDLSNKFVKQESIYKWFEDFLNFGPSLENVLPAFVEELEKMTNFPLAYSIYWRLHIFFKQNKPKNPDNVKKILQKYKGLIVTNLMKNPYSIFEVTDDHFSSLVATTSEVSTFVDGSNDPIFLRKFFIKCEYDCFNDRESLCQIVPMIKKRIEFFGPYLDAWIEESESTTEMAPFVACKMLISNLEPDFDEGEDGCSFSIKRISEYVEKHYPGKTALFSGETVSKR